MTKESLSQIDPNFRPLTQEGVRTLVEWAATEGWNPGPHDAEVYWNTDSNGFYGYYHNDELIGGGSIVSYGGDFGFMGFFIIRPEYRSNGLGRKLWYLRRDLLLSRLNPGASIGMDGVVAMQPFYEKGGFHIAFRDVRYERRGEVMDTDPCISPIVEQDFPSVLEYDSECFGFKRPEFLIGWLNMKGSRTFKYISYGKIAGYAVVRKALKGFKVGPLFADDFTVADALYRACLNSVPDEFLYLDIPMINNDAIRLVENYKAQYVFECARMYHGDTPDIPIHRIFGITTFELG